jgi:hypothetical protein
MEPAVVVDRRQDVATRQIQEIQCRVMSAYGDVAAR